ncbi:DUF4190 domain-containing protein [Nocardioides sp. C4-1]|uniref:DUF4190 domain-containing protein n=1 Tax=Nocardioides sp. C4-1 TaxID=3151851 RepID=UPI0032657C68
MTQPPYASHPYPAYGTQPPPPAPPTNGLAIAALVLGVLTLLFSVVPFVNLVGLLTGLTAIGLGLGGFAHARRHGRGAVMAGFGIGTAVVGMVVSVLVTFVVGKAFLGFFEEVTQTADVPEPAGSIGEWVPLDEDDVEVRLDDVTCDQEPADDGDHTCTVTFSVRNESPSTVSLGGDEVAAVVDDDYDSLRIVDDQGFPDSYAVASGETVSGSGTVDVPNVGSIDAVAFNLLRMRSSTTTVISVG